MMVQIGRFAVLEKAEQSDSGRISTERSSVIAAIIISSIDTLSAASNFWHFQKRICEGFGEA